MISSAECLMCGGVNKNNGVILLCSDPRDIINIFAFTSIFSFLMFITFLLECVISQELNITKSLIIMCFFMSYILTLSVYGKSINISCGCGKISQGKCYCIDCGHMILIDDKYNYLLINIVKDIFILVISSLLSMPPSIMIVDICINIVWLILHHDIVNSYDIILN